MASKLHSRSLKVLEERGWVPGTVERRMAAFKGKGKGKDGKAEVTPFGRTVDLWGWCDLVAFHPVAKRLAFVQVCGASGITSHKSKIEAWEPMRVLTTFPLGLYVEVLLHVWRAPKKGLRSRYLLDALRLTTDPNTQEFTWQKTIL